MDILVVDDDGDIRRILDIILTTNGYDVSFAPDADEALAKLSENDYDLVLLDIMMPGMSVDDFLSLVKDTKIVYCSALSESQASQMISLDNINTLGYIQKPFDMDHLLGVMHSVLRS